jgi:hypothetical protein
MKRFVVIILVMTIFAFRGNACHSVAKTHCHKVCETATAHNRQDNYTGVNIHFGAISFIEKKGA